MDNDEIHRLLRAFLDEECGLDTAVIDDHTLLFTDRHLNSLDILRVVAFIEERFGIAVDPMEVGLETLDTLPLVVAFVARKTAAPSA